MNKFPTFDDETVEYYKDHSDEIHAFLQEAFLDSLEESDLISLLYALRIIVRVRGLSLIAKEVGMSRQGLQKALSVNGNPHFSTIQAIMKALDYQLVPQNIPAYLDYNISDENIIFKGISEMDSQDSKLEFAPRVRRDLSNRVGHLDETGIECSIMDDFHR